MIINPPNKPVRSKALSRAFSTWPGKYRIRIGTEFFSLLVSQLGEVLGGEMCVYRRTRPAEDRSSPDAGSLDRTLKDGIVRISTGARPDAEVAKDTPCIYATGALEPFPEDRLLRDLEAQAWVTFH
jgi:hypothetical protein